MKCIKSIAFMMSLGLNLISCATKNSESLVGGWQRFVPGVARRSQLIEIKQLSDLQSPYVYF